MISTVSMILALQFWYIITLTLNLVV